MQIAAEANLLLTYHKLNVITTVGGVDMSKDVRYVLLSFVLSRDQSSLYRFFLSHMY